MTKPTPLRGSTPWSEASMALAVAMSSTSSRRSMRDGTFKIVLIACWRTSTQSELCMPALPSVATNRPAEGETVAAAINHVLSDVLDHPAKVGHEVCIASAYFNPGGFLG